MADTKVVVVFVNRTISCEVLFVCAVSAALLVQPFWVTRRNVHVHTRLGARLKRGSFVRARVFAAQK